MKKGGKPCFLVCLRIVDLWALKIRIYDLLGGICEGG